MLLNNIDFISCFETKLSQYTGFKYAVCVDCCTNAILLSLEALNTLKKIDKNNSTLHITKYTYMSIPMTLKNNGWKISLVDDKWKKFYRIGNTNVFDAATDLHENMVNDYDIDSLVCISFQQKKRLSLGRGGAILFNNKKYLNLLLRLRYDGRDPYIPDSTEILKTPNNIILGYHCYMEPDKAAKGILLLNQKDTMLKPYREYLWKDYNSLDNIKHLFV